METKIIEQKENPLFNRKEIILEVSSTSSPKNDEASEMVSKQFSVPAEQIQIKGIYGKFGTQKFKIIANVYNSIADKEKTEVKTKKQREAEKKAELDRIKAEAEEKKKVAEEAEAAKAEAEKTTEEPKEENKPEDEKTE
jgi:ribosomal protein S24E